MDNHHFLEKYNGLKLGWLRDSLFFIVMIAVVFVLFRFVIGLAVVGGESMMPTLKDGDVVMYLRMTGDLEPGDVVSVRVPLGEYYIKRIAATGGSTVDIHDGHVYIDSNAADDPHAEGLTEEETGAVIYPYAVREDNYFLLGDNREVSMDSRMFGEVSRRQIKGRIILKFSRGRISRVE